MSLLPWFTGQPNANNLGSKESHDYQAPAYAAAILITTTKNKTLVQVGILTGALALTAYVGTGLADDIAPFVGDSLDVLFASDATGGRIVTFGAGFAATGTLTAAASKYGKASFVFNGTEWVGSSAATV